MLYTEMNLVDEKSLYAQIYFEHNFSFLRGHQEKTTLTEIFFETMPMILQKTIINSL